MIKNTLKIAYLSVLLALFSYFTVYPASNPVLDQASDISTDTANFDKNLSASDDTVQKALETLDETAGEGSMVYPSSSGIVTYNGTAWGSSITDSSSNWNTAYSQRGYVGTKDVDETDIANGKILKYNSTSGKLEYETESGGGVWGSITGTLTAQTDLTTYLSTNYQPVGSYLESESDPNALLTAGTDNVKDTHIDWGSGAGQVNLDDIPTGSTNVPFTSTLKTNYDTAYGWGNHASAGYLTSEVDGSTTNEIQDLSLTGDTLSLSSDATTVDLSGYYNSLSDIQSAVSNDFHNLGGTDANTTYTAGDHLTLTGTDFDVDDDFLLNNGDTATGAYDFGGAVFEMPNGTSGTTDATGEIYLDTNGDDGTNFSGEVLQVYTGAANKYLFPMALPLAASQDNYIPKYDASTKTVSWEEDATGAPGAGDVESVGDCASGACFDGTQGTTLTFNNAGGDKTLIYNGTDFTFNAALTSGGTITSSGTFDVTGATGLVLGSADVTSFTITTDGTGNAEFILPNDVIGDADIDWGTGAGQVSGADITFAEGDMTDSTIVSADIKNGTIVVADTAITAGRSLTWSTDDLVADAELYTDTKCIYFENPVATDDFKSIWRPKGYAATITSIWAESDQTVTFMLQVDDGSPADVDTVDLAPAAGTAEDTSLDGDATLADGDRLDLAVTSVANTPTWCSICWTYTKDD